MVYVTTTPQSGHAITTTTPAAGGGNGFVGKASYLRGAGWYLGAAALSVAATTGIFLARRYTRRLVYRSIAHQAERSVRDAGWKGGAHKPALDAMLDADDGDQSDEVNALSKVLNTEVQMVMNARKMRFVVAEGKLRFGDPPENTQANRTIVDRWVRDYCSGRDKSSKLRMYASSVVHWAPFIVVAIFAPSTPAILAKESERQLPVVSRYVAYEDAARPFDLLDLALGRCSLREYFSPGPYQPVSL